VIVRSVRMLEEDAPYVPVTSPQLHCAVFAEALRAARASEWLSTQPPAFADALLRHATPQRWVKGETVISFEERETPLYFLLRGGVEVSVPRPSLDVAPIHVIAGGCWFGEHGAVTRSPSAAEFRPVVQSYALAIPRKVIEEFLHDGSWSRPFLELLGLSHRTQLALAADLVNHSSEQRVRARLGTLARLAGGNSGKVEVSLAIGHETLAAVTCTSRSTVCKVLNEMQDGNAIRMGYREIRVLADPGVHARCMNRGAEHWLPVAGCCQGAGANQRSTR
jgi:CRP/FNR family transcriptional regulator, cyclic AMP receptor protein